MEDSDDLPPYWQPPATLTQQHRRRASSPFLNSSLMIILLPSILLLFIVLIVIPSISRILPHNNNSAPFPSPSPSPSPPIHNHNKSISLKKGWDSLNIVLVLFAILCGIFAKRNDNPTSSSSTERQQNQPQAAISSSSSSASVLLQRSKSVMHQHHHHQQSPSVPQWFDHYSQHHRIITSPLNTSTPETTRLRRTVSSDPYMRDTGNNQFRFFDDLDVTRFYPREESLPQHQPSESIQLDGVVKDIPVDTFVLQTKEELPFPPQTPPRNPPMPPPPPPPPPPTKQRRTFQTLPHRERAPPSSPSPPAPPCGHEEKKRSSRKRTTKDIATAIVSLYSHGKRKRRLKSTKNHDLQPQQARSQFAPPPSPPPPPPSVFHNLFKKTKKIHSLSSIPAPPPPPSRLKKPPLPKRRMRGNESPMNVVPSPPPPPPFKVSEMRFPVVGGGYVKVQSGQNHRCKSPEMDDADESESEMMTCKDETGVGVTCPSPDVNLKADTFIARHHDGWRLEKLNSWREKNANHQHQHHHNKAGE